jgi:5-methylcytosine-specific restriction endonuclease McrA
MRLNKSERAVVQEKFHGKCAYCGCELGIRWHADHFEPVVRDILVHGNRLVSSPDKCLHPERHCIENMMPSCPPCNISKGSLDLETWRHWLAGHLRSLNSHYPIYRLVKAYGLVVETDATVVFHFEKINEGANHG